jgi:hypothetical protein
MCPIHVFKVSQKVKYLESQKGSFRKLSLILSINQALMEAFLILNSNSAKVLLNAR